MERRLKVQFVATYKQNMSGDCNVWEQGKSSLEVIKQKIKNCPPQNLDVAMLELALIFDTKFDKCEGTMQKLQTQIDKLKFEAKELKAKNCQLSNASSEGLQVFLNCMDVVREQARVKNKLFTMHEKIQAIDLFVKQPSIQEALEQIGVLKNEQKIEGSPQMTADSSLKPDIKMIQNLASEAANLTICDDQSASGLFMNQLIDTKENL